MKNARTKLEILSNVAMKSKTKIISFSLFNSKNKLIFFVILLMTAVFGFNKNNETIVLKLSENQPPNNPVTKAMYQFSELVKEKSEGKLIVEVYPSAQLGTETEAIEQIQGNLIDLVRVNAVTLAQTATEIGVFTLPYIFSSLKHKYAVLDGKIGEAISKDLEKYNMVNLGYLEAGTRNFYTRKPVKNIKDLKGMKIRVQPSNIPVLMVKMIGAVPTPMNYGEVYSALETGIIDGAENDFVSYYTSSHYEVAKNYILDGHLSPPALIMISKKRFDSLSPKHQKIIVDSANEATKWERKEMLKFEEESEKKVREAGSIITKVDIKSFQKAVQGIYSKFPEYSERIKEIRALD